MATTRNIHDAVEPVSLRDQLLETIDYYLRHVNRKHSSQLSIWYHRVATGSGESGRKNAEAYALVLAACATDRIACFKVLDDYVALPYASPFKNSTVLRDLLLNKLLYYFGIVPVESSYKDPAQFALAKAHSDRIIELKATQLQEAAYRESIALQASYTHSHAQASFETFKVRAKVALVRDVAERVLDVIAVASPAGNPTSRRLSAPL